MLAGDRVLRTVLTFAVLAMAVVLVRREFFPARPSEEPLPPPVFEPAWEQAVASGTLIGDAAAPIRIVEFADLQCPACGRFQTTLRAMQKRFGATIAVIFVHFPLPYHEAARPMARGAECAKHLGRFAEFVSAAFDQQDSLAYQPAWYFAAAAGISDSVSFAACLSDTLGLDSHIRAGIEAGNAIRLRATPTIIANGWRFARPPSEADLAKFLEELLDGKHPTPKGSG